MLTPLDFELKYDFFFKIRKNLSEGPLCITDLEYELHDKENTEFR
jgi:hypothetical protein